MRRLLLRIRRGVASVGHCCHNRILGHLIVHQLGDSRAIAQHNRPVAALD
jgi:hypothetical protein